VPYRINNSSRRKSDRGTPGYGDVAIHKPTTFKRGSHAGQTKRTDINRAQNHGKPLGSYKSQQEALGTRTKNEIRLSRENT